MAVLICHPSDGYASTAGCLENEEARQGDRTHHQQGDDVSGTVQGDPLRVARDSDHHHEVAQGWADTHTGVQEAEGWHCCDVALWNRGRCHQAFASALRGEITQVQGGSGGRGTRLCFGKATC